MNVELQTGTSLLGERKGCEESAGRGGGGGGGSWLWGEGGREQSKTEVPKFHVAEAQRIRVAECGWRLQASCSEPLGLLLTDSQENVQRTTK